MATTTNWSIDPAHSQIQFKVKHMVITTVTGSFKEFNGSATAGDDFQQAQISFEANVNSIDTHSEQRDTHLKSADFFEAEKFPKLSFSSTKFTHSGGDLFTLEGNLTIKDVTKPVKLEVEYNGTDKDPWGNTKAGFDLRGKINRKDFGLTWNALTEAGGALVSEEVKLEASLQLIKNN